MEHSRGDSRLPTPDSGSATRDPRSAIASEPRRGEPVPLASLGAHLRPVARPDAVVAADGVHGPRGRRAAADRARGAGDRPVRRAGRGADRRREGRQRGHLRAHGLGVLPALCRARAGRVLRHVADGRRSRGQDDHVPVLAADSPRRRAPRQVPGVPGVHGRRRPAVGGPGLPADPVEAGRIAGRRVHGSGQGPGRHRPGPGRPTAPCSRGSAPSSSGRC